MHHRHLHVHGCSILLYNIRPGHEFKGIRMYKDKGEEGEREGVRKAEREGRRVGGRKAHVTPNGNAVGCNMYS